MVAEQVIWNNDVFNDEFPELPREGGSLQSSEEEHNHFDNGYCRLNDRLGARIHDYGRYSSHSRFHSADSTTGHRRLCHEHER